MLSNLTLLNASSNNIKDIDPSPVLHHYGECIYILMRLRILAGLKIYLT